jgi:hypothetical protein
VDLLREISRWLFGKQIAAEHLQEALMIERLAAERTDDDRDG